MSDSPIDIDEDELFDESHCALCQNGAGLDFDFTFAFQPIVDANRREIRAYEALVRGLNGEGAGTILQQVTGRAIYQFDQACRVKAVKLASDLGLKQQLSINFMPNAVYSPATCIRTTLAAARQYDFDTSKLVFEFTESETLSDTNHLVWIIDAYREMGFTIAIDDYGAGYSRINLLTDTCPQYLKLDMSLIRDCDRQPAKQALIEGTLLSMGRLGIETIAEGVETEAEYAWCRAHGINLFQGYLLARPGFQALPEPYIPVW
ncbi:EAL domain-containing protein [Spiribacter vilamensis]|uniref:EAL domain-containing protein (Putative c-di-GMP-specific phosphodiesterase class I) n=1 Tax=Spiribacter vilamensis TaxID=531306 RepID=A0A4Q8CZF2_9GAMM|nr:EAL domain-containing protein [Spiribacter vilamensis]RZU98317.1 EAL domain-containing protein (putative c-di-GMP-specific phosphodiesterase class I) [Spiribacter vilamensis]TVO60794.1 EAL domain-containing protein [Spiribacter vilamensis]